MSCSIHADEKTVNRRFEDAWPLSMASIHSMYQINSACATKNKMWPSGKSPVALKAKEQAVLERLFVHSPQLKQVYDLRKPLTQIFERDYTKTGAKCAIRAWWKRVHKSGFKAFDFRIFGYA